MCGLAIGRKEPFCLAKSSVKRLINLINKTINCIVQNDTDTQIHIYTHAHTHIRMFTCVRLLPFWSLVFLMTILYTRLTPALQFIMIVGYASASGARVVVVVFSYPFIRPKESILGLGSVPCCASTFSFADWYLAYKSIVYSIPAKWVHTCTNKAELKWGVYKILSKMKFIHI